MLKINVFAQIGSTNLAKITNITTYVKLKIETLFLIKPQQETYCENYLWVPSIIKIKLSLQYFQIRERTLHPMFVLLNHITIVHYTHIPSILNYVLY